MSRHARRLFLLFIVALWVTALAGLVACNKPSTEDSPPSDPPVETGYSGPCGVVASPSYYNIPDYPCPPDKINGWIGQSAGVGDDMRGHAWSLFSGINQTVSSDQGETFLWRTWKTSTDVFPGQYGSSHTVGLAGGVGSLALAASPGGRLEQPAPGTPGLPGEESTITPGVDRKNLALPNAPAYTVPSSHDFQSTYASCLLETSQGLAVKDGEHFQNNGDAMVAGVIYDPEYAAKSITDNKFWDATYLDGKLPPEGGDPTSIWMTDNSIVLKPMLWVVPGDAYVALPLWDANEKMSDVVTRDEVENVEGGKCETYSGFERQEIWKDAVALTAGAPPEEAGASYLKDKSVEYNVTPSGQYSVAECKGPQTSTDPIVYPEAEPVSLDRFYTERFSEVEWNALTLCDRAIVDQSAIWSIGRPFDYSQDALVLIAMHIMTKERTRSTETSNALPFLDGWTFQTAWWHKDALSCGDEQKECGGYAKSRPAVDKLPGDGLWKNYLISTTYGTLQKKGASWKNVPVNVEDDVNWPVAFNPYIELAATHPVETNCINCHNRAAWPGRLTENPTRKTGSYLAKDGPDTIEQYGIDNELFKGLLTLDSMWASSDRAYAAPPGPVGDEPASD